MFGRILLVGFVFGVFFPGAACAGAGAGGEERIVGSAFKTLAKAYVATANLQELKNRNIKRVERMDEDRFREKYAEVYEVLQELPSKLRERYGVTENLGKNRAVAIINSMDKSQLYEIIESVPNAVIAKEFNKEFQGNGSGKNNGNRMERIQQAWGNIVNKINPQRVRLN